LIGETVTVKQFYLDRTKKNSASDQFDIVISYPSLEYGGRFHEVRNKKKNTAIAVKTIFSINFKTTQRVKQAVSNMR